MTVDKVLIVDDNPEFLDNLKGDLKKYKGQFKVLITSDGEEAIKVLKRETISLLATGLKIPKVDGLELLAHMTNKHPGIPCIAMIPHENPEKKIIPDQEGILQCIQKPFDFNELAGAIIEGLELIDEGASLGGVSLSSFLPFIEMEQKTCLLEVQHSGKEKGLFYFDKGVLYDALYDGMKGEAAAIVMINWENVVIRFKDLPKKTVRKRINTDLTGLIMGEAGQRDESAKAEGVDLNEMDDMEELVNDAISKEGVDNTGKDALDSKSVQENPEILNNNESSEKLETIEEGGEKEKPVEDLGRQEDSNKPVETKTKTLNSEGETKMAGINDILEEMAGQIDGLIATAVVGMDGIPVSAINPAGADLDTFSAKFAMVMKLVEKSATDLKMGTFEENLVQTDKAWLLTRQLTKDYYLGIEVSRESTLGNVRLVSNKYVDPIMKSLG